MVEHDDDVGRCSICSTSSGVTDNTIVMYSTDNGAEEMTWPDGGTTPFRGEKNTTFEGGFRVPCLCALARGDRAGNRQQRHRSARGLPATLLAAAGQPDITEQLLDGLEVGDQTYKVHIDGYNFMPYWSGEDDDVAAARSSSTGPTTATWRRCATTTGRSTSWSSARKGSMSGRSRSRPSALPKLMNLRADPFEDADTIARTTHGWLVECVSMPT